MYCVFSDVSSLAIVTSGHESIDVRHHAQIPQKPVERVRASEEL
jgi:hypothetical protein